MSMMRPAVAAIALLAAGPSAAAQTIPIAPAAGGVIAPRLPAPPVPENDPPRAFLEDARAAANSGRTGEALEALERAETRLLDRSLGLDPVRAPDSERAVLDIGVARQALAGRDRSRAVGAIDDALAASGIVADPVSSRSPNAQQIAPAAIHSQASSSLPPSVTYALLPGHWMLKGRSGSGQPPMTSSAPSRTVPSCRAATSGAAESGPGSRRTTQPTDEEGTLGSPAATRT